MYIIPILGLLWIPGILGVTATPNAKVWGVKLVSLRFRLGVTSLMSDLVVYMANHPLGRLLGSHGCIPYPSLPLAERHRLHHTFSQGICRRCQRTWSICETHRLDDRRLDFIHTDYH
jgi:hypothetical protein